jgi:nitrite reductase/ring-hydroxylating ferredoxin subunit
VVATGLVVASLVQRARGRRLAGRLLGLAGVSVAGLSAGMGGHLAYRFAAGANHAEDVPHRTDEHWSPVERLDLLPDRTPQRRVLGGTPVVVVRRGDDVSVLADACSHLSGPLSDGTLSADGACVVCPWHGSAFDLDDGSVRHGPATAPQPGFDVRIADGVVEARVRLPEQQLGGGRRLGEVTQPR